MISPVAPASLLRRRVPDRVDTTIVYLPCMRDAVVTAREGSATLPALGLELASVEGFLVAAQVFLSAEILATSGALQEQDLVSAWRRKKKRDSRGVIRKYGCCVSHPYFFPKHASSGLMRDIHGGVSFALGFDSR